MKKHARIITILLLLIFSTTAFAETEGAQASTEPQENATSATLKDPKAPEENSAPATTAETTSAQDPVKEGKDADSASEEDKLKTPVGTITDEKSDDEDLNAGNSDKKEEDLPPIKPVVFKAFDYKDAAKLIPTKYRKEWEKAGLPKRAINNALSFLLDKDSDLSKIDNERMVIIDFTQPSTEQRLFILNLKTGKFAKRFATHGKKSGNLYATEFAKSNRKNSFQTTPGFHIFAEVYRGRHGKSYRLDGLEERNARARERDIVVHGAMYATTDFIELRKRNKASVRLGLSLGCPAVSPNTMDLLLDLNLSGALLYNYTHLDAEAKVLLNP